MIVDTSAVIAIALQEPGWETLYEQAIAADVLLMSAGTLQELLIVAYRKGILSEIKALLKQLDLDYVAVDETLAAKGMMLYQKFGKKGGHPAQLNYGDCFAAAAASQYSLPLLYIGDDFTAAGF